MQHGMYIPCLWPWRACRDRRSHLHEGCESGSRYLSGEAIGFLIGNKILVLVFAVNRRGGWLLYVSPVKR